MLLFTLLLSIFSGFLFLIDLFCLGLAFWFFKQASDSAHKGGVKITEMGIFWLSVGMVAVWIISMLVRAGQI